MQGLRLYLCLIVLLGSVYPSSTQTNSVTDLPNSGDDSCSFEEIIERKRQAVKVQLLSKLNIRELPNNTRNDIPEDVRRQISQIYQEMVSESKGLQEDDVRRRPPQTKQNLMFPEIVKELASNTLLYKWTVHPGSGMVDRAEVHLPLELTVPSLRVYIVKNSPVEEFRREHLERVFGDRRLDVTKHWRGWTLDPSTNLGILFCVGRCFSENKTIELFGSRPYVTVDIPSGDGRRMKRYGRNGRYPQVCSSHPEKCCRKDHWVTFKEVGLDHVIVEPQAYNAGLCLGICDPMWLEQHHHSHVMSLGDNKRAKNCCSPVTVESLSIIYYDVATDSHSMQKLSNMEVTECGCK